MRVNKHQVFQDGVLIEEVEEIVSDEQEFEEQTPLRIKALYLLLNSYASDARDAAQAYETMTAAQRLAAQKQLLLRFGKVCDGLADLIMYLKEHQ